jgi:exodeoxyribonuclease VII large subunit
MREDQLTLTTGISYSPSALLQLFNTALSPTPTKNMIVLKGIYQPGRGANYNGFFYDQLKDEATDALLTLIVPALLRPSLTPGKTIEFHGYITKRVVPGGGRIEIHANIMELLAVTQNKYSEKEIRSLAIQQEKAARGYRDVDGFIKSRIVRQERVSVTILVGKTAIIDQDIRHAMEEAIGFYDVRFERISLSSEAEILEALERYNDSSLNDLLVLSRGGGENMEVFESPAVADACVDLLPLLVTAIGHKENVSLVQRVADKALITPTALGQWLREIYNDTMAEMENSKAKLVETITVSLKANYEKQVQNLQDRIRSIEELGGKSREVAEREVVGLKEQLRNLVEERGAKDVLLERTRELAEGYERQVRRLEDAVGSGGSGGSVVMRWVVVVAVAVAAGVVGWLLGRR